MTARPRPAIVIVSGEHGDKLVDDFFRYSRDYELVLARSAAEAHAVLKTLVGNGIQVAMLVSDWRAIVPTATD